ncbi:MAG: radical SAM protein [Thermoguttaceae bacterium]
MITSFSATPNQSQKYPEHFAACVAPLFAKWRTESGHYYIFDTSTNEIIRVGEVIYRIVDDYHVLTMDELIEKYRPLGENHLRAAVAEIERLESRGVLCAHPPQPSSKAERVVCQGRERAFETFLETHRRLLTLELTHRCNLECEYCCYGAHYPELRRHGQDTMTFETAVNAITDYANHRPDDFVIGFYGGEPLLEFELLKRIVLFCETLDDSVVATPRFNVTTNGTLLTDEVIHFLVGHRFNVTISLDGPKHVHDRYRVFRNENSAEERRGSFDAVVRNMRRFVQLYPDYPGRAIIVTLTATSHFDEVNEFVTMLRPMTFGNANAIFVRPVRSDAGSEGDDRPLRLGCGDAAMCRYGLRVRGVAHGEDGGRSGDVIADRAPGCQTLGNAKPMALPSFCNWTREVRDLWESAYQRFLAAAERAPDFPALFDRWPLYAPFFAQDAWGLHHRAVSKSPGACFFAYGCCPGSSRTFCASDGTLYPCERTERQPLFALGDATTGVSLRNAIRLTEVRRLIGDCANCLARTLCSLCLNVISQRRDSGTVDPLAFQRFCRSEIQHALKRLRDYVTLMETNPKIVDELVPFREEAEHEWLAHISYLPTEEGLRETELAIEEVDDPVSAVSPLRNLR